MSWDTEGGPAGVVTLRDRLDTGFYRLTLPDEPLTLPDIVLVRWNRRRTARYAQQLTQPFRHSADVKLQLAGRTFIDLNYLGAGILADLTPDDRVAPAKMLRLLARSGPYDLCTLCHRPPSRGNIGGVNASTSDLCRMFSFGSTCAARVGFPQRLMSTMWRAEAAAAVDQLERLLN